MADKHYRSRRAAVTALSARLRAEGWTWGAIAGRIQREEKVNARTAMRLARGWTQREVADRWNERFPNSEHPMMAKKLSYWEAWPAKSGREPSLTDLGHLAEIYECQVKDLIDSDLPEEQTAVTQPGRLSELQPGTTSLNNAMPMPVLSSVDTTELAQHIEAISLTELAQAVLAWTQRGYPEMHRRDLLKKLSAALTMAAAAPLFNITEADARERLSGVTGDPARLDGLTLTQAEEALPQYRKQGDLLGPHVALHIALAQREVIGSFVAHAPDDLKPRVLSVYAELSQIVGWQFFDLGDYRSAQYYYDDARTAAHDAENVELVSYVLCTMSQMATWQGKPRVGIDHAAAAQIWAEQSDSWAARGYAADVAAQAYAANGDEVRARRALDDERAAHEALRTNGGPLASWWYFYDESFYWTTRSACSLRLDAPDDAMHSIEKRLLLVDKSNLRDYALSLAKLASVHTLNGDVEQAGETIRTIAKISTVHQSPKISGRIRDLRAELEPWKATQSVRELDDALRAYGVRGA
ncbi:hypothetical protein RKE29_20865 [Streptomyces sp. B1866]|uniref:hypothetical protein n=1 Tax=Streptomyces sp. B1866 TaxID=3075431 RepID=UPI00288DFFE9|nr:hypothetical protein [Streptomyces sp. B1866]MDT3399066.1 hypothetical protein [Streptomyces sp. B1866]